ncbi:hypothetical protein FGE12_19260 [Aggregicoccus sp. 17bor-14]|nr:hypothetical protein [Aggregicoccus sp. 17bor-14]
MAPAPPEPTWAGLPPEDAHALGAEVPSLKAAGAALLLVAVTNLLATLLLPREASAGMPVGSTLAPSVIDLFIGGSLLAGNAKHLDWARLRVVLGALIWSVLLGVQGNWVGVVMQLVVSAALALLLWGGGRVRRVVALSAITLFAALTAAGTLALRAGANLLAGPMMSLQGELEPLPSGELGGRRFPYGLTPPGGGWLQRTQEAAAKDNPLADRWLVLPSADAHLMILAEPLEADAQVDLARVRSAVLENMHRAAPDFAELPAGGSPLADEPGYVHAAGTMQGQRVEMEIVVRAEKGALYQLFAFAPAAGYARVQGELAQAVRSFHAR